MAVKALENPNKVWQRVRIALANANEASARQFLALKMFLATQGGNPQLQFVPFNQVAGDQVSAIDSGGATVYGVWIRKQNTGVDAFFKLNDSATLSGGAAGINTRVLLPLLEANDEACLVFPKGLIFATGLVVASETTAAGGADTAAADGPNGFAVVG